MTFKKGDKPKSNWGRTWSGFNKPKSLSQKVADAKRYKKRKTSWLPKS